VHSTSMCFPFLILVVNFQIWLCLFSISLVAVSLFPHVNGVNYTGSRSDKYKACHKFFEDPDDAENSLSLERRDHGTMSIKTVFNEQYNLLILLYFLTSIHLQTVGDGRDL
jgi:hypothetical protein